MYKVLIRTERDGQTTSTKEGFLPLDKLYEVIGRFTFMYGVPADMEPQESGKVILDFFKETKKGYLAANIAYWRQDLEPIEPDHEDIKHLEFLGVLSKAS